jgi:hypothetical protein
MITDAYLPKPVSTSLGGVAKPAPATIAEMPLSLLLCCWKW